MTTHYIVFWKDQYINKTTVVAVRTTREAAEQAVKELTDRQAEKSNAARTERFEEGLAVGPRTSSHNFADSYSIEEVEEWI